MTNNIKDGYQLFFNYFSEISNEKMIDFGLTSLISTPENIAKTEWESLKAKLLNNEELSIRGYGRDAKGTPLYFHLYKELFNNSSIKKDSTNNHNPTKVIQELTGFSKKPTKKQIENGFKTIQNFQISHVFGNTKNPLLFTAPWNIIILPKIMDPFTGHEAKGDLKDLFTKELQRFIYSKYQPLIEDYNNFTRDYCQEKISETIEVMKKSGDFSDYNLEKFEKDAISEWQPIQV